jgi:hypothetical protein
LQFLILHGLDHLLQMETCEAVKLFTLQAPRCVDPEIIFR